MAMKLQQKQKEDVKILEVSGDIDFYSSPDLRSALHKILEKEKTKLLVNLKKVPYIDSSGLATFVELLQKTRTQKGSLVLAELSETVRGVFQIAKLDSIFQLASSDEEALRWLSSSSASL